jgi:hypothetical protein
MTGGRDDLEREIAKVVATYAAVPPARVNPATRLWHDLKLSGEDFAEVIDELHRTHGVTLRDHLGVYCPTEPVLFWQFWRWPFEKDKTYRELTVRDLATSALSGIHVG